MPKSLTPNFNIQTRQAERMEWTNVLIDWVNCLQLGNTINSLKELADGKIIRHIVKLLFLETESTNKLPQSRTLEKKLQDYSNPAGWVDYDAAFLGNEDELQKILTILIGLSIIMTEEDNLFTKNPVKFLNIQTQHALKDFLEAFLGNGKVVDRHILPQDLRTVKVPKQASGMLNRKVLFPKTHAVPESPHLYSSSPNVENIENVPPSKKKSPLKVFLESPQFTVDRHLLSEKKDEISSLRLKISAMEDYQKDIMDELSHYKNEQNKLSAELDSSKKEISILSSKLQSQDCQTLYERSLDKMSEKNHANEKLIAKYKALVEQAEQEVFNAKSQLELCNEELNTCQLRIKEMTKNEKTLFGELSAQEVKQTQLQFVLDEKSVEISSLYQQLEDMKECVESLKINNSIHPEGESMSESMALDYVSFKSNYNTIQEEDMASCVIDIQLKEKENEIEQQQKLISQYLESVNSLEKQIEMKSAQLEVTQNELTDCKSRNSQDAIKLQESFEKLQDLEKEKEMLGQQISAYSLELDAVKETLLLNEQKLESCEEQIVMKSAQLEVTLEELLDCKSRNSLDAIKLEEVCKKLGDVEKEKHILQQQNSAFKKDAEEFEGLKQILCVKDKHLESLEEQIVMKSAQLEVTLEELLDCKSINSLDASKLEEVCKKLGDVEKEKHILQQQNSAFKKDAEEFEGLKQILCVKEKDLESLEEQIIMKSAQLEVTLEELLDCKSRNSLDASKLEAVCKKLGGFEKEKEILEQQISAFKKDSEEFEGLKQILCVKEKHLESLEEQLESKKRELAQVRGGNIELHNKTYSLESKIKEEAIKYDNLARSYNKVLSELQEVNRKLKEHVCAPQKPENHRAITTNFDLQSGVMANESVSSASNLPDVYSDNRHLCSSSLISIASVQTNGSAVPSGAGSRFTCEDDEEGFQFSEKSIVDLKRFRPFSEIDNYDQNGRISELQRRNTLLKPAQRSCYPAESQFFTSFSGVDENKLRMIDDSNPRRLTTAMQKSVSGASFPGGGRLKPEVEIAHPIKYYRDNNSVRNERDLNATFTIISSMRTPNRDQTNNAASRTPLTNKVKSDSSLSPPKKAFGGFIPL